MRKLAFLMALVLTLGVAGMASAAPVQIPSAAFNDSTYNDGAIDHDTAMDLTDAIVGGNVLDGTTNDELEIIAGTPAAKLNGAGWDKLRKAIDDWADLPANAGKHFKLTISNNQENIPADILKNVSVITEVSLPVTTNAIGAGAFEGMDNLAVFRIATGAPIEAIPDNLLKGSTKVATITLSGNIKSIGAGAFAGTSVTGFVTVGDRLETIGAGAFENCTKLINVDLSTATALKTIGDNAFSGAVKLKTLTSPNLIGTATSNKVETIGAGAFKGCKILLQPAAGVTVVTLDLSTFGALKTIGASAFEGCEEITEIDFTDVESLTTVGDAAFKGMKKLDTLINAFEDEVVLTSFGANVFEGTKLKGDGSFDTSAGTTNDVIILKFGDDVTKIGTNAFWQMDVWATFRHGTTKPELRTPKDLADFFASLDIKGAFKGAAGVAISIGDSYYPAGQFVSDLGLVIENTTTNPDTKYVVRTLYGAGLTPVQIVKLFDVAGGQAGSPVYVTYPLTLKVVEDIIKGVIEDDGDYDYDGDYGTPGTPGTPGDPGTPGGPADPSDPGAADGGSSGCDVTGLAPLAALLALGLAKVRKYRG